MERRLLLVLVGVLVTLSCYSQNPNRDSDRNEYRDSVVNSDSREWDVREETDGSDDTTDLAVPSRDNSNSEVSTPSKGTGTPGLTGNGVYDVDGKVNGKVDASKKREEPRKTTPKNKATGRDVE